MKMRLVAGILTAVLALTVSAMADPEGDDQVLFQGTFYCVGVETCLDFATWGGVAAGYVEFTEPDGFTPSDYIWVDFNGLLSFSSSLEGGGFGALPPHGLPKLATIVEDGTLQEVDQYFPGTTLGGRPLFVQSSPSEGTTPEPSTLLLFGPAAVFLFNRARRFWRA